MRKLLFFIASLCFLHACSKKETPVAAPSISVVPKPASYVTNGEVIELSGPVVIVAKSDGEKKVGVFLQQYLTEKQINSTLNTENNGLYTITVSIIESDSLSREGYYLKADHQGIQVIGNSEAGLFYGIQTLDQLIPLTGKNIPVAEIEDQPRFAWRGMHLDVGRHMFPVDFIKKYIDLIARHKLNRFHWHLTEDQGWRIEIKKYPKLQEVGAYRKETAIGRAGTKQRDTVKFDGKPYGGFYTQNEIKEVVQYAADRYITVIPEIELPGHALAALASYPNLGCTGGPYETATAWGIFDDVFCAGKEETFTFLQNVFDEVIPLFPSEYIHIGGDECRKTRWEKCPHCQQRIKTENLKDEHELQSYFIQRIEKYVNGKGKKIIGWDEILEGGLAPNATVMSWRGESGGISAAQQNHDVIMSPEDWCYLDHAQDTVGEEPVLKRGYTPVREVYIYEPVSSQLSAEEAKHVLGAQCNVWTEYMKTPEQVEYMSYPRACALAEVVWSKKDDRNYDEFLRRMEVHLQRLAAWHVNYAKHIEKEFKPTAKK